MGTLYYGAHQYELDDRLLAHLQVIITMKLRRGERFFLSWRGEASTGRKRASVWIDNGIPIVCAFEGGRHPSINREWIRDLTDSANTAYGLMITDESTIVPLVIETSDASDTSDASL